MKISADIRPYAPALGYAQPANSIAPPPTAMPGTPDDVQKISRAAAEEKLRLAIEEMQSFSQEAQAESHLQTFELGNLLDLKA